MSNRIHNKIQVKDKRKFLRNNLTPAEATLWKSLQQKKLGRKFRRQHSVGKYILDFYCPSERLGVELDGEDHYSDAGFEYDQGRTAYLEDLNIRILRFENKEVFEDLAGVLEKIKLQFS